LCFNIWSNYSPAVPHHINPFGDHKIDWSFFAFFFHCSNDFIEIHLMGVLLFHCWGAKLSSIIVTITMQRKQVMMLLLLMMM
jgi:hypothetical protein